MKKRLTCHIKFVKKSTAIIQNVLKVVEKYIVRLQACVKVLRYKNDVYLL